MYGRDAMHYHEQTVATATPAQLVTMLYDRILTAIDRAVVAEQAVIPDYEVINRELGRAQEILLELRCTLDRERGGDVASGLDSLYDFCFDRLVRANLTKDLELTVAVADVIGEIRDAWDEACTFQPVAVAG